MGEHFLIDRVSGQLEALTDEEMALLYDAPEISTGFVTGIASSNGVRGSLVFRGVNDEGVRIMAEIWDMQYTPTSALDLVKDGEEENVVDLSGRAYPVTGMPEGQSIGRMTVINGLG